MFEGIKKAFVSRSNLRRSHEHVVYISFEEREREAYEYEMKLWRDFYSLAITQCSPEMVGVVLSERRKDFNYIQEKYNKATVTWNGED